MAHDVGFSEGCGAVTDQKHADVSIRGRAAVSG
jgi:hypothetical protein